MFAIVQIQSDFEHNEKIKMNWGRSPRGHHSDISDEGVASQHSTFQQLGVVPILLNEIAALRSQ